MGEQMRRGHIAMLAVLLAACFLLLFGCVPQAAKDPNLQAETATPMPSPTPSPSPSPSPSPTPVPGINAAWYDERNEELFTLVKRDGPKRTDEEIHIAVDQMYIDPEKPMIALTFDDGPMPGVTDKILDVLEQYNVRATFFVCGWRFKREPVEDIARRMVALGCEIGNHTTEHENLSEQNIVEKRNTIEETNKLVYDATGYVMHSLRPPGGRNEWEVNRVARSDDMAVVLWSQSGNVHEFDPEKVMGNVLKQEVNGRELQDGDIVLLHDTKPHMVEAVKLLVPELLDRGYQLVTVWELLNCSEDGFVPGVTYRHR